MVACRQANKFSDFVREMNDLIEMFILSLHEREVWGVIEDANLLRCY